MPIEDHHEPHPKGVPGGSPQERQERGTISPPDTAPLARPLLSTCCVLCGSALEDELAECCFCHMALCEDCERMHTCPPPLLLVR